MRLAPSQQAFRVDEVPAYEPSGSGEHLYVHVEKHGLTTDMAARLLATALGVAPRAVGYAGRKDRNAITRQWFSVLGGDEAGLERLEPEDSGAGSMRVLSVSRHRNKLRLGHLRGNRFELALEPSEPGESFAALEPRLSELARSGLPNRIGAQRFGRDGSTLRTALAWGAGERPRGDSRFRKLVASAAQSAIFNAVLEARAKAGLLHQLREGDLAARAGGRAFRCDADELADLNRRAAPGTLELAPTGPLPGSWRLLPDPEILAQERAWSRDTGVSWEWFEKGGPHQSPGDRRVLVTGFLEPPALIPADQGARVVFALPRGSYATEVLRELDVEVPEDRGARS